MPRPQLPPSESFNGRLVLLPDKKSAALLIGSGRLAGRSRVIHRGDVTIYFAFPLLYSTDFMFPQLAVDDFRREYHGQAAVEFMLDKGNSYPRADAVGIRISDYQQTDYFMKEVDIAAGLRAFAYASSLAGPPLARVEVAVWLDSSADPQAGLIGMDEDDYSLLRRSAKRYRCNPASRPGFDGLFGAPHAS